MQGAAREPPGADWVVREEGFPQRQRRRWPFMDRLLIPLAGQFVDPTSHAAKFFLRPYRDLPRVAP